MILSIIQARMSSRRLPGKVLMPLFGVPMLLLMVDRVMEARKIDKVVVATSIDSSDDPIWDLCNEKGIPCYRGDLFDVLGRFYTLAQVIRPEHIVRLTGDCPMIDSEVIDKTVLHHVQGGYDYTRNQGYPDGMDVEVMTFKALQTAWKEAQSDYDREHVCPYLYGNPDKFKIGAYQNGVDQSNIKISVDTPEDYQKLSHILEVLICLDSTFRIVRHF